MAPMVPAIRAGSSWWTGKSSAVRFSSKPSALGTSIVSAFSSAKSGRKPKAADNVPNAIHPKESVDKTRNRSWIGVT